MANTHNPEPPAPRRPQNHPPRSAPADAVDACSARRRPAIRQLPAKPRAPQQLQIPQARQRNPKPPFAFGARTKATPHRGPPPTHSPSMTKSRPAAPRPRRGPVRSPATAAPNATTSPIPVTRSAARQSSSPTQYPAQVQHQPASKPPPAHRSAPRLQGTVPTTSLKRGVTDVPVGAWTAGLVLDLAEILGRGEALSCGGSGDGDRARGCVWAAVPGLRTDHDEERGAAGRLRPWDGECVGGGPLCGSLYAAPKANGGLGLRCRAWGI